MNTAIQENSIHIAIHLIFFCRYLINLWCHVVLYIKCLEKKTQHEIWIELVKKIETIIQTVIKTAISLTITKEIFETKCHSMWCDIVYSFKLFLGRVENLFRKQWEKLHLWWLWELYTTSKVIEFRQIVVSPVSMFEIYYRHSWQFKLEKCIYLFKNYSGR